jgi:Flp pilus assembly protein TadD
MLVRRLRHFAKQQNYKPDNSEFHNNLGLALIQVGDAGSSISEFQTALRLRPNDSGYQGNLGVAYLQRADFDSAINQFQSALKLAPQDATLHYDLGLALKLKTAFRSDRGIPQSDRASIHRKLMLTTPWG